MKALCTYIRLGRVRAWLFLASGAIEAAMAGALGYVFSFSFLGQGNSAVTFFFVALFALVPTLVRVRRAGLEMAKDREAAWGLRQKHFLVAAILTVSMTLLMAIQVYNLSAFPFLAGTRQSSFERLVSAVGSIYPYFELRGVSWENLVSRYRALVMSSTKDAEFLSNVGKMLAELNDGHTGVLGASSHVDLKWLGLVRCASGEAVVTAVRPTLGADGLERGAVILTRDGMTPVEFYRSLPKEMVAASTSWGSLEKGFSYLLAIPEDRAVKYTYKTRHGQVKEVEIRWDDSFLQGSSQTAPSLPVRGEILPSGIGYIAVDRLWGDGVVAEFDRLVDSMMDAKGIILDLRLNGGGNSLMGDAIAGRFVSSPFIYGVERYRSRIIHRAWARQVEYSVKPRGQVYDGPLVVLTDTPTFSSAEMLVVALKDSGRAVTVGRNTGGGSGNPITFYLPGGAVRFSTGDMVRSNGMRIEGTGVAPDFPVDLTAGDIAAGIDRDLTVAEEVILSLVK